MIVDIDKNIKFKMLAAIFSKFKMLAVIFSKLEFFLKKLKIKI
jgi:hypothetical protein